MDVSRMHCMIEKLSECAKAEFDKGIENIDTCEMGQVTDMLKDLAEAMYYRTLTNGMEEFEPRLPKNNCFQLYKTISGGLAVESVWGWNYDIDDVLEGDKRPCFYALDKDGKGHRVYLDVL